MNLQFNTLKTLKYFVFGSLFLLVFRLLWISKNAAVPFEAFLIEAGKCSGILLIVLVVLSILKRVFSNELKGFFLGLQKPIGLLMFGFAFVHFLANLILDQSFEFIENGFKRLGFLGLFIFGVMAMTSNQWSKRTLKKNWKRVHRLGLFLGSIVVLMHASLIEKRYDREIFYFVFLFVVVLGLEGLNVVRNQKRK